MKKIRTGMFLLVLSGGCATARSVYVPRDVEALRTVKKVAVMPFFIAHKRTAEVDSPGGAMQGTGLQWTGYFSNQYGRGLPDDTRLIDFKEVERALVSRSTYRGYDPGNPGVKTGYTVAEAIEAGKELGADAIVIGSFARGGAWTSRWFTTALAIRMIDVRTGRVLWGAAAAAKNSYGAGLVEKIVETHRAEKVIEESRSGPKFTLFPSATQGYRPPREGSSVELYDSSAVLPDLVDVLPPRGYWIDDKVLDQYRGAIATVLVGSGYCVVASPASDAYLQSLLQASATAIDEGGASAAMEKLGLGGLAHAVVGRPGGNEYVHPEPEDGILSMTMRLPAGRRAWTVKSEDQGNPDVIAGLFEGSGDVVGRAMATALLKIPEWPRPESDTLRNIRSELE